MRFAAVLGGLLLALGAGASGATSPASGATTAASSPGALPAAPVAAAVSPAQQARIAEHYGQLPISFEANRGQTDAQVRFLSRGAGYALFLTASEAVMSLSAGSEKSESRVSKAEAAEATPPKTAVLRWQLLGGDPAAKVSGEALQAGRSHYFTGNDPKQWHTDVEHYAQVRYQNVYPGIDLVYHGQQQHLEYDFVVAPQADPAAIRMRYSGQQALHLNPAGDLVISSAVGDLVQHKPLIYQTLGGERKAIDGRFELRQQGENTEVAFALADYDRSQALVIDPVLVYSTYLGGSSGDVGDAIAVDSAGNAYVTGYTSSTNFPLANALQGTFRGYADVFVTKLNADGNALVYSTYLGGSSSDVGNGIAVDSAGKAYVTGYTGSTNFPLTNALQGTKGGSTDAFVTQLNADGSALVYSTYLGGSDSDQGCGIAVDSAGKAYVTGETWSTNFPLANALQGTNGGASDFFVTQLNADGSALVYSTYLGGSSAEYDSSIAVDSAGNAYVTGETTSTNFPLANALQGTFGGNDDAFVTQINADGSALLYSTYLGGSMPDRGYGIAVDNAGNAYVTGVTESSNFPLANALQDTFGGISDAFVTQLNADGSALVYSTYLGGSSSEYGYGIAVDSAGKAYLTGRTDSTNFPLANALQGSSGGVSDAFVTQLNADGSALVYSTYLGGSSGDVGYGITVDSAGKAYVTGSTGSTNFPLANALQGTYGGGGDAFVTRISPDTAPDPFSFKKVLDAPLNTSVTSNKRTLSGFDPSLLVSIKGGSYRLNGGAWSSAAGTVNPGDTVQLSTTSAATYGTTVKVVFTAGTVSSTWKVTTLSVDTTPDAFSFKPKTDVALNTQIASGKVVPVAYDAAATVTIVGGDYRITSGGVTGAWTNVAGSMSPGDTLQLRVKSSKSANTTTSTTVTVGGTAATFMVTTAP
ncbi:SBBP repeat-containing protein [Hydrocarboniphaga sp.]|uniref:SBBP repeat-containing protein n=1 Tax=Hydrocarboniphaga sp. TaxID=2033016 RepID=UPI00262DB4BF|nr:SBBP repeat-containing protein [Hydrocarboniphaga sp.]